MEQQLSYNTYFDDGYAAGKLYYHNSQVLARACQVTHNTSSSPQEIDLTLSKFKAVLDRIDTIGGPMPLGLVVSLDPEYGGLLQGTPEEIMETPEDAARFMQSITTTAEDSPSLLGSVRGIMSDIGINISEWGIRAKL